MVSVQVTSVTVQVWLELFDGPHCSQGLKLCSFVRLQRLASISEWAHGPILLLLGQHSSEAHPEASIWRRNSSPMFGKTNMGA